MVVINYIVLSLLTLLTLQRSFANIIHDSQPVCEIDDDDDTDQLQRERRFLKLSPLNPNNVWNFNSLPVPKFLQPVATTTSRPKCEPFSYEDCERRSTNCRQCYNCTCTPIVPKESHVLEIVSTHLASFECPKHYDPIIRQEPAEEPQSYSHMTPNHYHHLSALLSKSSSITPTYPGNFISPPPSQQTKEIIQLLIDLFENRNITEDYPSDSVFFNPLNWTQLVRNDPWAIRMQRHQFAEILPIEEVQRLVKENRPKEPIVFPPRRPDARYQVVDKISRFYRWKSKNIPIPQMLEPLYAVLTWQTQQEAQAESARQRLLGDLRAMARSASVTRPEIQDFTRRIRQGRSANHSTVLQLDESCGVIDDDFLFARYKQLLG